MPERPPPAALLQLAPLSSLGMELLLLLGEVERKGVFQVGGIATSAFSEQALEPAPGISPREAVPVGGFSPASATEAPAELAPDRNR